MSIEQDLNRIATALEEMVKLCQLNVRTSANQAAPTPEPAPVVKEKKEKAAKPAPVNEAPKGAPVVEQDANPFEPAAEGPLGKPEISFEELSTLLKKHSVELGTKVTIALIVKHGADRATPKLNTIPKASYQACYEEASNDLKKIGK